MPAVTIPSKLSESKVDRYKHSYNINLDIPFSNQYTFHNHVQKRLLAAKITDKRSGTLFDWNSYSDKSNVARCHRCKPPFLIKSMLLAAKSKLSESKVDRYKHSYNINLDIPFSNQYTFHNHVQKRLLAAKITDKRSGTLFDWYSYSDKSNVARCQCPNSDEWQTHT